MERLTAKSVFDLYYALSDDEKKVFYTYLGQNSTPLVPLLIVDALSKSQQAEFTTRAYGAIIEMLMPVIVEGAWEVIQRDQHITRERFGEAVDTGVRRFVEKVAEEMGEREREKLKEQRDRKSDPGIVRRNVEICELRTQDSKKWTQGRLAKKYDLTPQAIRKILGDEAKWRRLLATL